MRISKKFREGMEFPRRIHGQDINYVHIESTVGKAWDNTGRILRQEMNKYAKSRREAREQQAV